MTCDRRAAAVEGRAPSQHRLQPALPAFGQAVGYYGLPAFRKGRPGKGLHGALCCAPLHAAWRGMAWAVVLAGATLEGRRRGRTACPSLPSAGSGRPFAQVQARGRALVCDAPAMQQDAAACSLLRRGQQRVQQQRPVQASCAFGSARPGFSRQHPAEEGQSTRYVLQVTTLGAAICGTSRRVQQWLRQQGPAWLSLSARCLWPGPGCRFELCLDVGGNFRCAHCLLVCTHAVLCIERGCGLVGLLGCRSVWYFLV